MKHYFNESFRQLNTAITMPISAVIGPIMDQVVVLLIGLPPSTPKPWSAQIRPNNATINPTANVTTKPLLIPGSYAPDLVSPSDAARRGDAEVEVAQVGEVVAVLGALTFNGESPPVAATQNSQIHRFALAQRVDSAWSG